MNTILNTYNANTGLNESNKEKINHPSHYNQGSIETIDLIEDWDLDFCLGNTIKYISRAGFKENNSVEQDLKKAYWYLKRGIGTICKKDFVENKKNQYKYFPIEVCADWSLDTNTSLVVKNIFYSFAISKTANEKINYLFQALNSLNNAISKFE